MDSAFLERLCAHVRSRGFESCKGLAQPELERRVRIGWERAQKYAISGEWAVAAFVSLMFAVSPALDDEPEVALILADASIEPDLRVDLLGDVVSAGGWDRASKIDGSGVWQA